MVHTTKKNCYKLKSLIPGAQQNKIKPTYQTTNKAKNKKQKKYKQTKNKIVDLLNLELMEMVSKTSGKYN
jgi:hypothetical protein